MRTKDKKEELETKKELARELFLLLLDTHRYLKENKAKNIQKLTIVGNATVSQIN